MILLIVRYDPNDLALDTFTQGIIAQELAAITTRPFPPPETWVFSAENQNFGMKGRGAEALQFQGLEAVRKGLAAIGNSSLVGNEDARAAGRQCRSMSEEAVC